MRMYAAAAAACLALPACGPRKHELTSQSDKVSYSIGLQVGKSIKEQGVSVTPDIVLRGIRDGVSGATPALTDAQIQSVMIALQTEMATKARSKDSVAAEKNQKEGEAFLAANKTKPGVVTRPSGLQYKVIKEGSGPRPTAKSTVTVHYRGTLLNGDEFDSSYKRNEPATFPLGGVIPGWTEGVQLMNAGAKYEFYIPAALAYGAQAPPNIGPNQTLIFEVELLSFK